MEGQAHPTYHEIGLDHTIISTPLYEPHYPHMAAMKRELSNWHTFYLEPRTLMRDEVPLAEIQSIGPRGENLPAFLNTLRNENRRAFDDLNKTLALALPRRPQLEVERSREGRVGLKLSEDGQWFSARQISEGTLRLIGLLAAIHPLNPSTLVAYEEPENGVHPSRLKIISDLLKSAASDRGKQVIVTTHSPILPTYFPGHSLYVSRREAGKSVISPFASQGPVFKQQEIETALEDAIVRGDYGG
jgi:predicted ATPase